MMNMIKKNEYAFVLMEVLIVIAIIAALAAGLVTINILRSRQTSEEAICVYTRGLIEKAELQYTANKGEHSSNPQDLIDEGYLTSYPKCPADGIYAWQPYETTDAKYQAILGCSVHGAGTDEVELTSLGSTFEEITSGLMALIEEFHDENERYPRGWGDYVFTDIGLDPEEWEQGYGGLIYSPGGNRIKVEPDEGYKITVTGLDGEEKVLTSSSNWNLWYDMKTEKWYYHRIEAGNEVDIETLIVKEE